MNSIDPSTGSEHFSGKSVVEFILDLARLLTGENMPGWVSLVLVVALVGLSLWYLLITWRFVGAVRSVRAILRTEGDRKITRDRLVDIDREFAQARRDRSMDGWSARGGSSRRLRSRRWWIPGCCATPCDLLSSSTVKISVWKRGYGGRCRPCSFPSDCC
ncbi:MAG: hypothetical protein OXD35_09260 [Thiotrichales bacterium]|nr:hypothetical protein [Thiotrichales bacterium]